jgi:hypothetical protein
MFLYDNFPTNDDEPRDALALILGALRGREPGVGMRSPPIWPAP